MTEEELFRSWIKDLEHQIGDVQQAIYGDKKAPPNSGGVYGELRRIREEMRSNNHDRQMTLTAMEQRLQALEDKVDAIDRRIYPSWWGWIIVGGGFALIVMLLIHLAELARVAAG
jgi:hypothetical protein